MLDTNTNAEWLAMLQHLLDRPQHKTAPRDLTTREVLGRQCQIDMEHPVLTVATRQLGYKFMLAEAAWILSGDNRVTTIASYAKHIVEFSDDGSTFAGAYGPPLRDQLPWVVAQLARDPATRQAVATIWRPRPGPSKDIPCTLSAQWLLREDASETIRLHCVVTMRSSDAWLGAPYDWFNFSAISAWIAASLLQRGCLKAVCLGTLYFTAGSQHLYEKDIEGARRCVAEPAVDFSFPLPWLPAAWANDPDDLITDLWDTANLDLDHLDCWESIFLPFLTEQLRQHYCKENES